MKTDGASDSPTTASEPTIYDLTSLAARICPSLCQTHPNEAIRIAQKLLAAAGEEAELKVALESLEKQSKEAYGGKIHFTFDEAIKQITGEGRMDRALPPFRRFLKSKSKTEKIADDALVTVRKDGLNQRQVDSLADHFQAWRQKDKAVKARASRAKRRKPRGKR